MDNRIIVFTDGASKGNPGPGGWGAIVSDGRIVRELGGREERTTNNRMELQAALEALRTLGGDVAQMPVAVHTDSSYLIKGMTAWIADWKRRDWKTHKKEDVLNKDIWSGLSEVAGSIPHRIEWVYVGGHVGIPGNERVDTIASCFAEGKNVALYNGPAAEYTIDLSRTGSDVEKSSKKLHTRSRSKIPAHSYVSEIGGVVAVHKTWAECEARVKGKRARFKKALSSDDEREIIKSFSKP